MTTQTEMTTKRIESTAFALGFIDGRKVKKHISRKQAERKLRGLHSAAIDCYLNGHDDGVKGDDFRYRLNQIEYANA